MLPYTLNKAPHEYSNGLARDDSDLCLCQRALELPAAEFRVTVDDVHFRL